MRVALAMVVVIIAGGPASAEVKRKVYVDSDPPGADVYLNSKDDGSLCKTPCTIDAPVGDMKIIVELANHVPLRQNLTIPRRGRPAIAKFKLLPAVGTIKVTGPKGASISISDVDRGVAPKLIDIEAGPYVVVLSLDGKQIDAQPIEVVEGEEVEVAGPAVAAVEPVVPPVKQPAVETPAAGALEQHTTTRPARGKLVRLSAAFDVGFRSFVYEGAQTPTLRKESEVGQVLGGGVVELWLGNLLGVSALRGLSLYGRLQVPINEQPVTGNGIVGTTKTFWQSFEATVRQRWTVADQAAVEIGAGYARDQYEFSTNMIADLDLVPEVAYQAVKLGLRGSLLAGEIEPYAALGYRLVLSGGALEDRFPSGARASGIHAALGIKAGLGPLDARIEGSLTRYDWTFKTDAPDKFKASGAVDSILLVSTSLGYAF